MAKIISISQQKGGVGKSTIAAHLGVILKQKNKKVGLIDIDPQATLSRWHQAREDLFGKEYTGFHFSAISGIRVSNEISNMKLHTDYIIIDCPPHTDTETRIAIRSADLILIPMQPSPTDLWATNKTLDFARNENKRIKLLMNRCNINSKIYKKLEIPKEYKEYILNSHLGNRVGFASCMIQGKSITEQDPNSIGANEVKKLLEEMLNIL